MPGRQVKQGPGFFDRLKSVFADKAVESTPERRASKRVELAVPVRLKIGPGDEQPRRLRDISQLGLCLEGATTAARGDDVTVAFDGYPEICDAFVLSGRVARTIGDGSSGLAIEIDRQSTLAEALLQYRKLVLHYLRHRPLLEELDKGYFEGKCESCGWIGRVGERTPICARCGQRVVPVHDR